jgi:hypothetical protein
MVTATSGQGRRRRCHRQRRTRAGRQRTGRRGCSRKHRCHGNKWVQWQHPPHRGHRPASRARLTGREHRNGLVSMSGSLSTPRPSVSVAPIINLTDRPDTTPPTSAQTSSRGSPNDRHQPRRCSGQGPRRPAFDQSLAGGGLEGLDFAAIVRRPQTQVDVVAPAERRLELIAGLEPPDRAGQIRVTLGHIAQRQIPAVIRPVDVEPGAGRQQHRLSEAHRIPDGIGQLPLDIG